MSEKCQHCNGTGVEPDPLDDPGYQEWLEDCAQGCECCPSCWDVPCPGCQAGGMCDRIPCSCDYDGEEREWEEDEEDWGGEP